MSGPYDSDTPFDSGSSYGIDETYETSAGSEELLDDSLYVMQDRDVAFGRNLVDQVRAHPVPVLLTGIGVTWLLASSLRASREEVIWHDETGAAGTLRQGQAAARQGYEYLRYDQPLVLGALAIAAGALLGSLLPESAVESSYLGDYSDRTRSRVKDEVEHASILVKEAAVRATEGVREAMEDAVRPEPRSGVDSVPSDRTSPF